MGQSLWETVEQFLIKLTIYLPFDPASPLLSSYPRPRKKGPHKDLFMKLYRLTHNSPKSEQPNVHQQMDKL